MPFMEMVEASQRGGLQRGFTQPPSEEKPPQICPLPDGYCPRQACPQRNNPDQHGKPCWYYTEENRTAPMPHSIPQTSYSEHTTLTQQVEKAVKTVLEPLNRRLAELENAPNFTPTQRSFNGTPNEALPVGFPRLFQEMRKHQNTD